MAQRLVDFLPDFGAARVARPSLLGEALVSRSEPVDPLPVLQSSVDQAVADAEARLSERLQEEHREMIEAIEARHAHEMATAQEGLARDAGERIAAAFAQAETQLTQSTQAACARILGQMMGDDLVERSLDAVGKSIRSAIRDDESVRIVVKGARSVYEPLAAALGSRASQIDFSEATGFDVSVVVGDRHFETRLGEWWTALEEIVR